MKNPGFFRFTVCGFALICATSIIGKSLTRISGKMEGEEKSKKVAKEKRSVKKSKTAALPAKEVPTAPVAETLPVRKSTGTGAARRPVRSSKAKEPSFEQVQLRAYFIGERRKSLGIPGNETSDWVQAEIELKAELAPQ
jgi:hypothetical protein